MHFSDIPNKLNDYLMTIYFNIFVQPYPSQAIIYGKT